MALPSTSPSSAASSSVVSRITAYLSTFRILVSFQPNPRESFKRFAVSWLLWFVTYYIMGFAGGAVAYWRFKKMAEKDGGGSYTDSESDAFRLQETLPDMMFDIFPEFCPRFGTSQNIQSLSLVVFYCYTLWVGFTGHPRGRLIIQRFFLINSLMFLTRTTVVGVTSLPNPNYHPDCIAAQKFDISYVDALAKVCGEGFPPHACGDLIYSGHTACTFMSMYIFHKMKVFHSHTYLPHWSVAAFMWFWALAAIVSIFGCRSHYTVDVVLGIYFAYFLSNWYFQRAEGVIDDRAAAVIRWLEGQDIVEWNERDEEKKSLNGDGAAASDQETEMGKRKV
jgi:hypothetical protein